MGGKPKTSTAADQRLKENKAKAQPMKMKKGTMVYTFPKKGK